MRAVDRPSPHGSSSSTAAGAVSIRRSAVVWEEFPFRGPSPTGEATGCYSVQRVASWHRPESYRKELLPYGRKLCPVSPGGFFTGFRGRYGDCLQGGPRVRDRHGNGRGLRGCFRGSDGDRTFHRGECRERPRQAGGLTAWRMSSPCGSQARFGSTCCMTLIGCDVTDPEIAKYAREKGLFVSVCTPLVTGAVDIPEDLLSGHGTVQEV